MGIVKTSGIIISENNSGDYDKMLTMLTPGQGKISCFAKGARKPKSILLAGTQLLSFGEYIMYKGSNNYKINSCKTIEVFYNIRTDLDKLKYAVDITKIIQKVTQENQNSFEILQLYLNTLYTISELEKNLDLVISTFKLRLLCILGFRPIIEECTKCRQKENLAYFSIINNGYKCEKCGKQDESCIAVNKNTQNAIKYIILAPPKKIYSFTLKDESLKELELLIKIYFKEKFEDLGTCLKSLGF